MLVSDFDFHLPAELIAQHPAAERAASRLLHLTSQGWRDTLFSELPRLLRPTDLLVLNDTRVLPARLFGHRSGRRAQPLSPHNPAMREFLHGRVEVLLTRRLPGRGGGVAENEEQLWQALVRPGRKIMPGERLYFGMEFAGTEFAAPDHAAPAAAGSPEPQAPLTHAPLLEAEVLERGEFGERVLRFLPVPDFFARLEALGHIPLPPYIDRADEPQDRERYQTVFAREAGSVAAPTAGLHFTPEILDRIRERGVEIAWVTLHVGLGTFAPIRSEVVEEHRIHTECYRIPEETAEKITRAKREGRRVVAVGTTTVRTLEYAAAVAERQYEEHREQGQEQGQLPHFCQRKAEMGHSESSVEGGPHFPAEGGPHPPSFGECGNEGGDAGSEGAPYLPSVGKCGTAEPAAITAHSGEADIFIYPGYQFRVVDAMLTNFHLPKSTLLMLVCAFAGRERVLAAYEHAVRERYRFFSYGDCMLIE